MSDHMNTPRRPQQPLQIVFGVVVIGFGLTRLPDLITNLPILMQETDSKNIMTYGVMPAFILLVCLFVGGRAIWQGWTGRNRFSRFKKEE